MHLNLHAKVKFALVSLFLLNSCDGPGLSDKQRDEVGDIAGDVVGDVIADDDKVRELEGRIEAIEQQLGI